jgi:DNA-binding NarL/FixJ family response regulator
MSKKAVNIIIAESSEIIFEGLFSILTNADNSFNVRQAENLPELELLNIKSKADLVLINPLIIQNQIKEFQILKKEFSGIHWIGILYSFIDPAVLTGLDEIININDKPARIIASIHKHLVSDGLPLDMLPQETLSEREIDVLKLLVAGNANKEIADKLNISTHTVISHRKNISQKTGIKSVSGLTIYAVVKNIITIDSYRE